MDATPGDVSRVVVENRDGKRELRSMFWGLKRRTINVPGTPPTHARAETLLDRPMFRDLVLSRRCIVPMGGWVEKGSLLRVKGELIIGIAGLYDAWPLGDRTTMESFCLITVDAIAEIRHLNIRMPAIVRQEDEEFWLSRSERDVERILSVLRPFEGTIIVDPVKSGIGVTQRALDLGNAARRRSDD